MLDTLLIAIRLRVAYTMNGIQYYIRRFPLIKRLFVGMPYDIQVLKIIFGVLGFIVEATKKILYKFIYVLLLVLATMWYVEMGSLPESMSAQVFMQTFLLFTLIGGLINNPLFETERADYYAIVLLRMNGKKYVISQYIFYHIYSTLIMLIAFMTVGHFAVDLPFIDAPLFVLFIILVKLSAAGITLMKPISKLKNYYWLNYILAGILLLISILLPVVGYTVSVFVMRIVMLAFTIPAAIGLYKLSTYKNYTTAYRKLISDYMTQLTTTKAGNAAILKQSREGLADDTEATSNKSGYAFMHELFIKRHVKLLWKPAFITAAVAGAFFTVAAISIPLFSPIKELFSTSVLNLLPPLVFFMYFLNRGLPFTQALYVNCDHSMLTFSFYRRPGAMLRLFMLRLISIIKINLVPALVIGIGLAVLQFEVSPVKNPVDYAVLIISTVSLSIFFSVHYLVIYYLLQPYNVATEIKSPAYSFVKWATYFVCYMIMIQVKVSSVTFGIGTIVFCVLYCIIACVLVYFLAPKTFHIKN